jgi:hypothetical protein
VHEQDAFSPCRRLQPGEEFDATLVRASRIQLSSRTSDSRQRDRIEGWVSVKERGVLASTERQHTSRLDQVDDTGRIVSTVSHQVSQADNVSNFTRIDFMKHATQRSRLRMHV